MPDLEKITISPGLTFDALVAGEAGAPLVLLLHGFAESMHCWRAQVEALAAAGYRAIAPSQRGYSPGARPDTGDTANYHIDRLMDDAMAIVAASGYGDRRFHLAGHDWGGRHGLGARRSFSGAAGLAYRAVAAAPQRLQSGLANARWRSSAPLAAPQGFSRTRRRRCRSGRRRQMLREAAEGGAVFPVAAIEQHLAVLGNKDAMEAALAWYRARGAIRGPLGPIRVPTLYIWGDADDTVGRIAAEGTSDFIAAPYRFEVLSGVGHFAADQAPDRVNALLRQLVAAYPV